MIFALISLVLVIIGAVFGAPLFYFNVKEKYPAFKASYAIVTYFFLWFTLVFLYSQFRMYGELLQGSILSGGLLVVVKIVSFAFLMFLLFLGIYTVYTFFKRLFFKTNSTNKG